MTSSVWTYQLSTPVQLLILIAPKALLPSWSPGSNSVHYLHIVSCQQYCIPCCNATQQTYMNSKYHSRHCKQHVFVVYVWSCLGCVLLACRPTHVSSSGSLDLNIDGLHMASGEASGSKGLDSPRTIMIRANMLKVSLPPPPSRPGLPGPLPPAAFSISFNPMPV